MKTVTKTAMFMAFALTIIARPRHIRAALPPSVVGKMDTSVDPCDDFYQYSCGAWLKNATIPQDDILIDPSFAVIAKQANEVVKQIVKEQHPYTSEFWASCMNTDRLEQLGSTPLNPQLQQIAAAKTTVDVMKVAGQTRRLGASFITNFDVLPDLKDATKNVLYMGLSSPLLPDKSYYLDNQTFSSVEQPYRTYITSVMKLAGFAPGGKFQVRGDRKQRTEALSLDAIADKIIAVETALAGFLPDPSNSDDPFFSYHPTTVAEATAKYPLSFGAYTQGFGLLEKSSLKPSSKIIFYFFDYFDQVEAWLKTADVVDLKLYLSYRYIYDNDLKLSDAFDLADFEFFGKFLSGQPERSTRDVTCVYKELFYLPDLIGKYYFDKMFDKTREDNAKLMVNLIEQAMHDHISKLTWLDDKTRTAALKKLSLVINLIGHSTEPINIPFKLKRDNYFWNTQTMLTASFDYILHMIGNVVDRNAWGISAAEVNAYYYAQLNQMEFPAAILQAPFFSGSNHPAQNFGGIGVVIGHELTHGFDTTGRQYDGYGNVVDWWDATTAAEFDKRAQCMRDQYSAFVINGEDGKPLGNVNGNMTITENIADNGGFSLSWDAYHAYMKTNPNVPTNGVLPQEADKLFFLSHVQIWCQKERDEAQRQDLQSESHSPAWARAIGVIMNSANFGPTFQCKAGSKMNPTKKCQLW